jgi:gamma-tubulin complex component 2
MAGSTNGGGYKSERPDAKAGSSSQGESFHGSFGHKRSASGNPRPMSVADTERRYEERRITERTYEAQVERMVPRATSPEKAQRKAMPAERKAEEPRQRSSEFKARESRPDAPQGMGLQYELAAANYCTFLF